MERAKKGITILAVILRNVKSTRQVNSFWKPAVGTRCLISEFCLKTVVNATALPFFDPTTTTRAGGAVGALSELVDVNEGLHFQFGEDIVAVDFDGFDAET